MSLSASKSVAVALSQERVEWRGSSISGSCSQIGGKITLEIDVSRVGCIHSCGSATPV